jgi:hypothetical protein
LILAGAACVAPIRQFDIENQPLTCQQANEYSLRALQAMGFAITALEPASPERPGLLRGTRSGTGDQRVSVRVICTGRTADVDASEDGKLLGQLEFKRGFYLAFAAIVAQAEITAQAARAAAAQPAEKRAAGLRVLLQPIPGLAAKLEFDVDLAAAGVLPVRVSIDNGTGRTYAFDPGAIALIQQDGTRVHALAVDVAAQRVADAQRQADPQAPSDVGAIASLLRQRLLPGRPVGAHQSTSGYLYFPLGQYVKGRVSLEDLESEETEGFVVEF